jgi:hypothetical protein
MEQMPVQVAAKHYISKKYASLERFISYFYQIDSIYDLEHSSILFIGVGDSIVSDFLKRNPKYTITTMDIDPELKPDVVGDIRSLPFPDQSFDTVCVFEVLEHLPFEETKKSLAELSRVARKHAIISVPHRRTGVEIVLKFPFIRSLLKRHFINIAVTLPVKFPGFAVSKQHYWEIDGYTTKLSLFRKVLGEHFTIMKERVPVLDFYHRFFILKK